MKKVLFVCLGNICRSPLAEGIMKHKVEERGLSKIFHIDSCGTSSYHIGDLPDPRTRENAFQNGILLTHRARQFSAQDLITFDHVLVMDRSNYNNIKKFDDRGIYIEKIRLMRDFDTFDKGSDVPDPYYGGPKGFQEVFDILDRSIDNWLYQHL